MPPAVFVRSTQSSRMPLTALARRYALFVLSLASGQVMALDAAPTLDQANAALHAALSAERAGPQAAASPLGRALLESLKFSLVQGCQSLAPAQTACIVKIEAPMRDAYQVFAFDLDGADWRLVKRSDIEAPQPTLGGAQALLREHLQALGARETDARRAAEYRRFALALEVAALESCDLDRDSGAVECDAQLHTPGAGAGSKRVRFQLQGSQWSLLPD
ncbi:hypothetical protein [Lysobacter sp. Root604]|uniref:hypothetical protein n=1 Tax=Lysobacter sp. Root604 TaxID=1736568 RepID=UPI0012FCC88A|nr:hypothetical protein [Lysobacter sp. Root604]